MINIFKVRIIRICAKLVSLTKTHENFFLTFCLMTIFLIATTKSDIVLMLDFHNDNFHISKKRGYIKKLH